MNSFRLNLIRDQVPSLARRRGRYGAMVVYLVAAGVVLVVAVGMASVRVAQAQDLHAQSQRLEKMYAASHGGEAGIKQGANRLHTRLAEQMKSLRAVNRQLSGDARPARLVRALALSLPPNMSVRRVSLNGDEKTLAFELFALGPDGEVDPPELMSRWQKDPAVAAEAAQIVYLGSEIESPGANGIVVLRFSGRLAKGAR